MDSDFEFDMTLDDNGVLIFRLSGVFDVDKWADQHRAAVARLFPDGFDPTRPAVTDLRRFRPPQSDWNQITKRVFSRMDELGASRRRSALITGGNPGVEISCRFFIVMRNSLFRRDGDIRVFRHFDDGYAWAAEALDDHVPSPIH